MSGNYQNNRSGRGRGPRNGNVRASRIGRTLARSEHRRYEGHSYTPAIAPPKYVRLPWNSFTFSATYATSETSQNIIPITLGTIRGQLINRMGLQNSPGKLVFKIVQGEAWNVATGNGFQEPYIRGLFYEVTPGNSTYAFRTDIAKPGTLNRPARIGYHYPMRDHKELLTSAEDNYVLATFSSNPLQACGNITIRFRILWICTDDGQSFRSTSDIPEETDLELVR